MISHPRTTWFCDYCHRPHEAEDDYEEQSEVPVGWFHVTLGTIEGANKIEWHLCSSYCLAAHFRQDADD
jgi:hypothetical protein